MRRSDEIQRLEDDVRGAVTVRGLKLPEKPGLSVQRSMISDGSRIATAWSSCPSPHEYLLDTDRAGCMDSYFCFNISGQLVLAARIKLSRLLRQRFWTSALRLRYSLPSTMVQELGSMSAAVFWLIP